MNNKPRPKAPTTTAPRPPTTGGNGPRTQRPEAPKMNAPRPPTSNSSPEVMKRLTSAQTSTLAAHIGQGPGAMHRKSENRLHEERAYIYDRMSKGALMTGVLNAKTAISPFSTLKGADRERLTKEAMSLKPYKHEMKANNPEASRAEKVGKTAKYTKTGAAVVNMAGSAIALANPLAGVATKAAATGVGIGAGLVAAGAYDRASKAYAKNVDESATGYSMLESHLAKAKSDLNKEKRNNMLLSTGFSAVTTATGMGTGALMEGTSKVAETLVKSAHTATKATGSYLTKEAMDMSEGRHKSEIVNIMQHQRAFKPNLGRKKE